MYSVGLTLGKFAPFHRGHQFLVESALRECGRLVVVVYQAKRTTDLPLAVRAGWIRALYPEAEVLEAAGAPEDSGSDPAIRKLHEDFLRDFMAGRRVDAFFSCEPYGAWAADVLGCENRLVDPGRSVVPVSGTLIRSDPERYREFLHPLVFADLVGVSA